MKFRVTNTILVEGDLHQAGDELRCKSEGTIKAMLRVGQIEPIIDAAPLVSAKESDKLKKADK